MERTWPVRGGTKGRPVAERFWEKVDKSETCWLWMGARNSQGRGVIQVDGHAVYAHRLALEFAGRPLQPGQLACHTCDNGACVNPDHIYGGTYRSNAIDAVERKRQWQSSKTHCKRGHKMTPENTQVAVGRNRAPYRRCIACRDAFEARRPKRDWGNEYRARTQRRRALLTVAGRHKAGFGAYCRATLESPHPVPAVITIGGERVCAECTFPVV